MGKNEEEINKEVKKGSKKQKYLDNLAAGQSELRSTHIRGGDN